MDLYQGQEHVVENLLIVSDTESPSIGSTRSHLCLEFGGEIGSAREKEEIGYGL
jgi:hypothetical protein